MSPSNPIISVAPMMDWTDRHCRYFHRLIAPTITLYTEMVTTGALIHGDADRFLRFSQAEHPLILQLGGNDPADLATCTKMAADYGYDGVNLNCGCPSDRVQSGAFGAILMKDPALVRECVHAMKEASPLPISVKCRIGVDDCCDHEFLNRFIEEVTQAGIQTFIIHARKAWLKGLSPKENRDIPPLDYPLVRQMKDRYPALDIQLNGGIKTLAQVSSLAKDFDGLMIGREAYQNPWVLHDIEANLLDTQNLRSPRQVIEAMIPYCYEQQEKYGTPLKSITRHMIGLFQGRPGARHWRQMISTQAHKPETKPEFLLDAMPAL